MAALRKWINGKIGYSIKKLMPPGREAFLFSVGVFKKNYSGM
jgi:hypothetical protein